MFSLWRMLCNYSLVRREVDHVRLLVKTEDDVACHVREKMKFFAFNFDHITPEMNP